MRARVTQLWQTRMLRFAKLTVADEIENALSYYAGDLPARDPAPVRRARDGAARASDRSRRFLRMGNWIGGDRDGNPNVTRRHAAHTRCARQSETGAALLPDRGARARRRAVAVGTAGRQ